MIEQIKNNKKIITTILVALLLFCRCNLGVIKTPFMLLNLAINGLSFLYLIVLSVQDFNKTKKGLLSAAIIWVVAFLVMEYAYIALKIGTPSLEIYSRQFRILTVGPAILIFLMLWHCREDMLEILCHVGVLIIVATLALTFCYDPLWKTWIDGTQYRFGETPGGTVIDSGNLYMIMLIPILYKVTVEREFKKYLLPSVLGVAGIIMSGTKSALFPIIFVIGIYIVFGSNDKKTMRRNLIVLLILVAIVTIMCFTVPIMYWLVADRIIELFKGINATEFDYHTSTGQRMAIIAAFKQHFGEHPFFGHGFYAFKSMPYSAVTEVEIGVNELGQKIYELQNSQTHMNFLELLFSFGIFGFVMYYWFPVKLIVDSIKSKDKAAKMVAASYLVTFFFMDLGIDMFYPYITPFFVYFVIYCLLKRSEKIS